MHGLLTHLLTAAWICATCLAAGCGTRCGATAPEQSRDDRAEGAGTWRVAHVEINGRTVDPEITSMLAVRYAADGSWVVLFKSIPIAEGASTVDQSTQPTAFDMRTLGSGHSPHAGRAYLGIYEGHDDARRLCFVPAGSPRPAEFRSTLAGGEILVELRRARGGPDAITAPRAAARRESSSGRGSTPPAAHRRNSTLPAR